MTYTIYITTSNTLIPFFQKMESFELELGLSLTSPENNRKTKEQYHTFLPQDENIQAHYLYREEIINKIGNLGALKIYTCNSLNKDEIMICNLDQNKKFSINIENDLYKELNKCMGDFLVSFGYIKEDETEEETESTEEIKETNTETQKDDVLMTSNDVSINKVQETLQQRNKSVRMYENDNAETDLDANIAKPVVDLETLEKNKKKINETKIKEILKKPANLWTDEERILIARSR